MKECFSYWVDCPKIQVLGTCRKIRICPDERKCFTEWRKSGNFATKEMIEKWSEMGI